MGFSSLYKPGGKLFDKTADGKLLLMAPAAWPYSTLEKPMTRFDACVLNRIAQLIAGDGAAEINYKGMKPNDVERRYNSVASRDRGGARPRIRSACSRPYGLRARLRGGYPDTS